MKIVLKRDWDFPISPPMNIEIANLPDAKQRRDMGHYGGRRDELNKFINELLRRPKGSILISGYRGVGKTSFVYKALSELKLKDRDHEIIIVMLNAAQLDVWQKNNEGIDPKKIIENLIRRLYSITKDSKLNDELKKDINLLYKKAVASEVNMIERYQNQKNFRLETIQEWNLKFIISNSTSILIATTIFALILQYMAFMAFVSKFVPILIALFGSLAFFYAIKTTVSEVESITKSADETYKSDNCIGNLEFDLEELHKKLYFGYNKKILYIIDELDKLESNNDKLNNVDEILKYFKNFFTLSNAIFVFIGGEELYDRHSYIPKKERGSFRDKNYTYFTSKYFISRPLWSDLNSYLDDIIESDDSDDKQLMILKRALCFEAKNDFFDLRKFIDNRITKFDELDRPILEIDDLNNDLLKSRFHKAITLLYDEKYMSKNPVNWRENEQLIRRLYDHVYSILERNMGEKIEDPKEDTTDSQMIRDFNGFLDDLGALNTEQDNKQAIGGLQVSIRTYNYSGDIPTEPPLHLDEATEFERRYTYNYEIFLEYAKAIIHAFNLARGIEESEILVHINDPSYLISKFQELKYNISTFHENNRKIYNQIINKEELYSYRRDDIEKKTRDIENHVKSMLNELPKIIYQMIKIINDENRGNIKTMAIEKNNNVFSIMPPEIRENFIGNQVLANSDLSRQILLINKKVIFLTRIEAIIRFNESTHRIAYITRIRGDHQANFMFKISTVSPTELKNSIISFLIETAGFFKNQEISPQ